MDEAIKSFGYNTLQFLHPAGKVVVAIFHPWSSHTLHVQCKTTTVSLYDEDSARVHCVHKYIIGNGSAFPRMRAGGTQEITRPPLVALTRSMALAHCCACVTCKPSLVLLLERLALHHPYMEIDATRRKHDFSISCLRVTGALRQDEDVVVDKSQLVIKFPSHPGVPRGPDIRNHLRNDPGATMIAHKKMQDGSQYCTINERLPSMMCHKLAVTDRPLQELE